MPRKDITFRSSDLIRFFCFNLDKKEQIRVGIFFYFILPGFFGFGFVLDAVIALIPGRIGFVIKRTFFLIERILDKALPTLFSLLVAKQDQKAVLACLNEFSD